MLRVGIVDLNASQWTGPAASGAFQFSWHSTWIDGWGSCCKIWKAGRITNNFGTKICVVVGMPSWPITGKVRHQQTFCLILQQASAISRGKSKRWIHIWKGWLVLFLSLLGRFSWTDKVTEKLVLRSGWDLVKAACWGMHVVFMICFQAAVRRAWHLQLLSVDRQGLATQNFILQWEGSLSRIVPL